MRTTKRAMAQKLTKACAAQKKHSPMSGVLVGERGAVKILRRFCLQCQGERPGFVRDCPDLACPLYAFRLPESPPVDGLAGRAIRAVRRQCLACAGDRREVRACAARESCVLWPYRFGVLPATYKRVTDRIKDPKLLWLPGVTPCAL